MTIAQPERDLGATVVTPRMARLFAVLCLGLLLGVTVREWRAVGLRALAGFRIPVTPTADDRTLTWMLQGNRELLAALQGLESTLEDEGWLATRLIPPAQRFKLKHLRLGNESVYAGRADWLHYRPDVDYVKGPGFLRPDRLLRRSRAPGFAVPVQPDPMPAILDFAAQLRARGIDLILLPTPVKAELTAATLGGSATGRVANASFAGFVRKLEAAGLTVMDPAPLLADGYLRTDTHWRPEAMDEVARALAELVRARGVTGPALGYERVARPVAGRGDLLAMLGAAGADSYGAETVTVQEVVQGSAGWQPDREAAVLLLGDSFSNIYAQEGLGWGGRAGLAEQLSFHLQQPVDRLARNDAGSYATRDLLARELARGRDRLAGKRVVIWQFANRELAQGDWRKIPLEVRPAEDVGFLAPEPGRTLDVRGVVADISSVPVPGRVPYADHIAALHLVDVQAGRGPPGEAYVMMWSMTNHTRTGAARLRVGDEVAVRLRRWSEVAAELEAVNRSELEDETFMLAEPCWGEMTPGAKE